MVAVINDPDLFRKMLRRRRALGHDKFDEVWNGVYVMNAMPNNQHQVLVSRIVYALYTLIEVPGLGLVLPGANVSSERKNWKSNYRCPDVAVFLTGTAAVDCDTHWSGGPDFAVEILSPRDRARKKLNFYGQAGTRELLMVDRNPWRLELYRLDGQQLTLAGSATADDRVELVSEIVPLTWSLLQAAPRPLLQMRHRDSDKVWTA